MSLSHHLFASCMTLTVAGTASAATLLAHDPFAIGSDPSAGEYNQAVLGTTNSTGQNPSVDGFTGSWYRHFGQTSFSASNTGLSYGSLVTSGGSATYSGSQQAGARRSLDSGFNSSTEGVYYVSFLVQMDSTAAAGRSVGFLSSNNFGLEIGQISNLVEADRNDWGYRFSTNNGGSNKRAKLADMDTGVNLFVLRINMVNDTDGADSDSVRIYRNPTDLLDESQNTYVNVTALNLQINSFYMVKDGGNNGMTVDEVRFASGTDGWAQVVPVPEPTSFALFGGAGVALLARRRRTIA